MPGGDRSPHPAWPMPLFDEGAAWRCHRRGRGTARGGGRRWRRGGRRRRRGGRRRRRGGRRWRRRGRRRRGGGGAGRGGRGGRGGGAGPGAERHMPIVGELLTGERGSATGESEGRERQRRRGVAQHEVIGARRRGEPDDGIDRGVGGAV